MSERDVTAWHDLGYACGVTQAAMGREEFT